MVAYKARFSLTAMSEPDVQREHIETFAAWLSGRADGWNARPPVSVYDWQGKETLSFVVTRNDQVFGVFTSPMHALIKIGDPLMMEAYQAHMRDRRVLARRPASLDGAGPGDSL